MIYGVITELPTDPRGNSAMAMGGLWWDPQGDGGSFSDPLVSLHEKVGAAAIYIQAPVFKLGELLLLNEDGRELYGEGRKPSKWDVRCDTFEDPGLALACVERVLREASV